MLAMLKAFVVLLALACLIPPLSALFLALAFFVLVEMIGLFPVILLGIALWFLIKDK